jgi:hypothetical protein
VTGQDFEASKTNAVGEHDSARSRLDDRLQHEWKQRFYYRCL